jgi:hypothetical protein
MGSTKPTPASGHGGRTIFPFLICAMFGLTAWPVTPALGAGPEAHQEEAFSAGAPENEDEARDRWLLSLGAGLLSTSDAPAGTFTFDHALFGSEKGEFDAGYAGGEAPLYEVTLGRRLRGRLGLGLAWSRSSLSDSADIAARLPHPFLFERPRSVEGVQGGLSRDETAMHLSLRWLLRDGPKVEVAVFGGPSRIDLDHELVSAVRFTQTYPFDTATFAGVDRRRASGSATGWHVGVDVARYLGKRAGLGAVARYSDASVDLTTRGDETVSVSAGGLQVVVDLRLRF